MTEVTTIRTHSAGMVYPLNDASDIQTFPRKTQFDPRMTNSAVVRGEHMTKQFREIKDSFQQAALINIVASVNKNENKQIPVASGETMQNTMNVITNLFIQRDRQISIPKPQVFMEAPKKFSIKKPLYNKKSGHQVTEREVENRKRVMGLSRTRPLSRDQDSAPKQESIKIAVSLQKNNDDTNSLHGSRDWMSSPAKVKLARSNSPRHRYAILKKKPDQRVTTSIPTCEAIDILDATESISQTKPSPVSPCNHDNLTSPSQDPNMYRAKSLPALFPVKRRKSTDSQNSISSERKNNINSFRRSSIKSIGGMPNLVVGKPFQGKSADSEEENNENPKPTTTKQPSTVESHLKLTHKELKEKLTNKENITLHGRSIPNPRPSSNQKYSKNPETDLLYSSFEYFDDKKVVKQLDKQFEDLRRQISGKLTNLSDFGNSETESSSDIASYNLVGKAFKSNLSTTSSVSKSGKQKTQKRVTFAEDTEENVIMCEKSVMNYDAERALLNARLMQTKYQFKKKDREPQQTKAMKPMSESDVTQLKQRLIPGVNDDEPKYKSEFLENFRISGMFGPSVPVRSSSRASDTNRSVVSEADTIGIEEAAREWNGVDIDATHRDRTEIPVSQGTSSFYPSAHDDDFDSDDTDDEYENMESYRVVKAVDLGKLSNFQHRKFKNVPHKNEPSTTHFVKIKVK